MIYDKRRIVAVENWTGGPMIRPLRRRVVLTTQWEDGRAVSGTHDSDLDLDELADVVASVWEHSAHETPSRIHIDTRAESLVLVCVEVRGSR